MPSVMARRETPVARATAETPPYPIASLSAAATKRRIRSSRKGDRERNRRWISLPGTSCSIKQIYPNLLYLFSDNPLVSLNTSGGTAGQFVYNAFTNPITLNANTTYYVLSQETAAGDQFYDANTTAQTTTDATLAGPVFATNPPAYTPATGQASRTYGPLDFTYVSIGVSPAVATLSAGQQQPFTVSVTGLSSNSVTWSLSPNVGAITANGVYTAPNPITIGQTVTVTATSTVDTTKSATAIVS